MSGALSGKKILLGVTGGIAAYKAVELASLFTKNGAEVHTVMTKSATKFVTLLTFHEITGQTVSTEMFGEPSNFHVRHIALARLADVAVIAPATANFLAKAANGIADDLLTTTILALKVPIFLAPSMNTNMYENVATQTNLKILRERGFKIIEPAEGHLACGTSGKGRLPEPVAIASHIEKYFENLTCSKLKGKKIIVTAGGTIEPIDPVRYIGNRSSGKMGFAIAQAAKSAGAEVILITGASALENPAGIETIRLETALQMKEAVFKYYENADAVIMSAAVADYRAKYVSPEKIKKSELSLTIELEKNPDILYELGQRKRNQILIGFAAETQNVIEYAKGKLEQKNLNFIVANDVTVEGAGFGTDTNVINIIYRNGEVEQFPLMSKVKLAEIIIDRLKKYFD